VTHIDIGSAGCLLLSCVCPFTQGSSGKMKHN
jgi:hypothetical protein